MAKAGKDLEMYATADGWFISLLAAVETEILNLMQMTNITCSLKKVVCRSQDCNLRWEDHYHIKISLDARRTTAGSRAGGQFPIGSRPGVVSLASTHK